MKSKTRAVVLMILIAAAIFLLAGYADALSFTTLPNISNNIPMDTTDHLICEWVSEGATIENISWFNTINYIRSQAGISSPQVLSSSYTARGDVWQCIIYINNGTHFLNYSSQQVSIENANPAIPQLRNQTSHIVPNSTNILEDTTYRFTLSSADQDGDEVDFTIGNQPIGSLFSSKGYFNWTPSNTQTGINSINFFASDDAGGVSLLKIEFNVQAVNDAPYFTPSLSNKTATEGTSFSYTINGADEESNYPLAFRMRSSLGTRLTITNTTSTRAVMRFNTTDNKPGFQDAGTYLVNVSLNDSLGKNTNSSFWLVVVPINHKPNLTFIPTQNAAQNNPFTLYIYATDIDTDDSLTFGINESLYSADLETENGSALNGIGLLNITLLNNSHITKRYVNVSVYDGTVYSSQLVFFNFTNANDAPQLFEMSFYANNTQGNTNSSNLTAYVNAPFFFTINSTDVDSYTYEGEVLNYSVNDSRFFLNSSRGFFYFTPNSSLMGSYVLNLTLSDDQDAEDSMLLNIAVNDNSMPYFNHTVPNMTCYEDNECFYDVNGSDPDFGDYLNYSSNLSFALINSSSGIMNFTANTTQLGNFSVNFTITDSKGAVNSTVFNLEILNTNDAPVLADVLFPEPVVATHTVTFYVHTYDEDVQYNTSADVLNYSVIISGKNPALFTIQKVNSTSGLIQFTPSLADPGNYTITIYVNDSFGEYDFEEINLTLFNRSNAPVIDYVTPWGRPKNATTHYNYTRNTFAGSTAVSIPENTTVLFNHTTIDDDTSQDNLTIAWYYNRTGGPSLEFDEWDLTRAFNFFSNGTYIARLVVTDDYYETATFQWNITVTNVNRAPKRLNALANLSVNGQNTAFNNYFAYFDSKMRFLDPDDDLDSNNYLDPGENNTLNFTSTACVYADFEITGTNIQVNPSAMGECFVYFNATDPSGSTIRSNMVLINITAEPEEDVNEPTSDPSGGGSSSSNVEQVPVPEEINVPVPIELVIPKVITIYTNKTLEVPIILKQNWTTPLTDVTLSAQAPNVTGVEFYFKKNYWPQLPGVGMTETTLLVTNYRSTGTYEIIIQANVRDPDFEDRALVVVNSLESESADAESVKQKITFARDLLNDNPECQELNELLDKATATLRTDPAKAAEMVDAVINGCKYIVNNVREKSLEKPKSIADFVKSLFFLNKDYYIIFASVLIILTGLVASMVLAGKIKPREKV